MTTAKQDVRKRRVAMASAVAVALAGFAAPASADRTWNGGSDMFWTTSTNWTPNGLPTSADTAIFNDNGAGTVDLNGTTQPGSGSLAGLTFNNQTTGYTLQNGTINLGGVLSSTAGAGVVNTISATLNSTGGITVSSGTLVLSNGNNSLSGPVSVAAGAKLDVLAPSNNSIGSVNLNGGTLVVRGGSSTVSGLQGRLYVDAQTDPRNNAAGVNALLATTPTNTAVLTAANGPNGGLDFRNDGDVQNFFNQPLVNSNGNHNYTVAFIGNYTAKTTGNHTFAFGRTGRQLCHLRRRQPRRDLPGRRAGPSERLL